MKKILVLLTILTLVSCDKHKSNSTDNSDKGKTNDCLTNFKTADNFELLNNKKTIDTESSETDTTACTNWTLTTNEIQTIIKDSEIISGPDWHHLFGHLPCSIKGQLKQNGTTFDFQINSGSWMTIACGDSTIFLGSFKTENEHLFMSTAMKEGDDK